MNVLRNRFVWLVYKKRPYDFEWGYQNLDTGERGTVQMKGLRWSCETVSVDHDPAKALSAGETVFFEINEKGENHENKNYGNRRKYRTIH